MEHSIFGKSVGRIWSIWRLSNEADLSHNFFPANVAGSSSINNTQIHIYTAGLTGNWTVDLYRGDRLFKRISQRYGGLQTLWVEYYWLSQTSLLAQLSEKDLWTSARISKSLSE